MLVNKAVEFFLSEVVRLGWARCRRGLRLGRQRARSEMPTGAEAGLAAEPPRTGVGGNQITSKENAL